MIRPRYDYAIQVTRHSMFHRRISLRRSGGVSRLRLQCRVNQWNTRNDGHSYKLVRVRLP